MNSSWVATLLSVLLLGFIALAFFYWHLRSTRDEALVLWGTLRDKMRVRLDMIPLLIENLRRNSVADEKMIEKIVKLRTELWPMEELSVSKIQGELLLSQALHELWNFATQQEKLAKDTLFLSLQKNITDLGKEIESTGEKYNEKIRSLHAKNPEMIMKIFGFKKLFIFEFEA